MVLRRRSGPVPVILLFITLAAGVMDVVAWYVHRLGCGLGENLTPDQLRNCESDVFGLIPLLGAGVAIAAAVIGGRFRLTWLVLLGGACGFGIGFWFWAVS